MKNKMFECCWIFISRLMLLIPICAQGVDFSNVPGVVLDHQPTEYGWFYTTPEVFISDPEIVVLSDGSYVAAHALAGRESDSDTSGITSVFRSTDQGANWSQVATINGALRCSLFEYGGALYMFGTKNDDGGPTVVCKSTDGGLNWTKIELSSNGGSATPNNPVVHGDRLWSAASKASMSAPVASNFMDSASWSKVTGFPATLEEWPGDFIGEAQVVASPDLGLFIMPKVKYEPLTALGRVDPNTGGVAFDPDHDFISLPGGEKKFGAGYDAVSGRFFVLSNPILPAHADNGMATDMVRNTAALLSTTDLQNWNVEKIFLYSSNDEEDGFGYLNFDIDGDDMVVASRTAFPVGGDDPERGHDSNLLTFHRIDDFRTAAPDQVLKLSGGDVLRYEKTDYQDAPLGSFALGSTFDGAALTNPDGFGKAANGDVYIRESGGRILQFDASGNFLQTTNSAPVSFQTSELSIDPPSGGACAWVNSGSGDWSDALNWYYWGRADTDEDVAVFGSAATAASTVNIASRNREWLFNTDGDIGDWTMANMTASVSGGTLQGTPSTTDCYLMHANQSFFGDEVSTITVRMRADRSNVGLQFYWTTAAENTYGGHVVTASYTGNGEYQDIIFTPTGHADWNGQLIKKIRVDPMNGSTTPFEIDSITVQTIPSVVKGLRFRNTQPYTLAGDGLLALDADSGNGSIEVQQGDHEIQVPLGLEDDADVQVETGSSLQISGGLDFNGNTLSVSGAGDLILTNSWQMEGGTLSIELGSLVTLDGGAGGLDGTLEVSEPEAFSPAAGNSFQLIEGNLGTNRFGAVVLPALQVGLGWDTNALYTSGTISVEQVPVDGTWDKLVGGTWSDPSRWGDGIIADGVDSTATFDKNITANRVVTLDSDRTIGHLFFRDSGGGTDHNWNLQSNTLTLETTSGRPTINIGSQAAKRVFISSVMAGTNGFEKIGTGTLLMNDNNTYTGDTVLSSGNIRFNANNALPTTSVLNMSGGTLQMMGYSQTVAGLDGSSGTVECNFNAGSTNVLTLAVAGSESYSFGGLLRDGQATSELNMVKIGTGTQAFIGANDYSGTTTVNAGTVIGGADGAFGTGSLTVADSATLVLAGGVSNSYVAAGATLVLGGSAALDLDFSGDANTIAGLSLDGGATWLPDGTYDAAALHAFGAGTYTGSGTLRVGEVVVEVGEIDLQLLPGSGLSLTWSNAVGLAFRVETNADLVSGQWGPVQSDLTATGGSISYTGTTSAARTFYRIVVE